MLKIILSCIFSHVKDATVYVVSHRFFFFFLGTQMMIMCNLLFQLGPSPELIRMVSGWLIAFTTSLRPLNLIFMQKQSCNTKNSDCVCVCVCVCVGGFVCLLAPVVLSSFIYYDSDISDFIVTFRTPCKRVCRSCYLICHSHV